MKELALQAWANYSTQFVSFGLTLLAAFVLWIVQGRAKIRWGLQHGFAHRVRQHLEVDEQKQSRGTLVHSSAILFVNGGRFPAKRVEVTLNFEPDSLAVWPQRQYTRHTNPDGRLVVGFESLAPREQLTLNLLTIGSESPSVLSVRAENTVPQEIPIGPARVFSRPMQVVFVVWLLLGIAAALYIAINVLIWLTQIGGS